MRFIHHSELDKKQWDQLVESHHADVFSFSWYLDSCASDWCVLADDKMENGIAISFTVKMGIRSVSPPIFSRNLDFIGSDLDFQQMALSMIQQEFSAGILQTSQKLAAENTAVRVFQSILERGKIGSQAKRMLQKSLKNKISIEPVTDWKSVLRIIQSELTEKISEFNAVNLSRLEKLIASLEKANRLRCLGIFSDGKLEGGMIFMESGNKRIYLKGAANREARDSGGMYLCMEKAIQETMEANREFDFGGSGVEGVRRFNQNLGGMDRPYYIYSWNNAPFWFNFTKWMYKKLSKIYLTLLLCVFLAATSLDFFDRTIPLCLQNPSRFAQKNTITNFFIQI